MMQPGMTDRSKGRRRWLRAAPGLAATVLAGPSLLLSPRSARAHAGAGPVDPPLPAPPLDIRWHDGSRSTLAARLQGRITALQTMFTTCSVTCPLQGALFAALQGLLDDDGHVAGGGRSDGRDGRDGRKRSEGREDREDSVGPRLQLLSLSIDPMTDEPAELARWLDRFGAGPRWQAGAPTPVQVDVLLDFLRARSERIDRHTGQVYLFDGQGELVMRTVDLPPPAQVADLMRRLARRAPGAARR